MIHYSVSRINPSYDFDIYGVSYIGEPKSHTAMYVTKKIVDKLQALTTVEHCVVFVETGTEVSEEVYNNNLIVFCDNPQFAYVRLAKNLALMKRQEDRKCAYRFQNGSYISESAVIGDDAYIEPGCRIGHHVMIGNGAVILTGTIIRDSVIGDGFLSNEYAVIGANGFTMADDEKGNKIRIPSLGGVRIGNNVEVGAHDNLSRGSAGDTIIEDNVKLDAFVHIGHDAVLRCNVEVTAGAIVGGFDVIETDCFLGLNAALRNRISIGSNVTIGMGAVVTKSVDSGLTVVGNPAKDIEAIRGGIGQTED